MFRKVSFPLISSIFLTVLPVIFSSALTLFVIQHEGQIAQLSFLNWVIISVICCFTSVIALSPPTFLALIFGYFLGWKSLPLLFGLNMGAIFLVNRIVSWSVIAESVSRFLSQNQKVVDLLESIKKEEFKIIFFTKLSPVMPFALTNIVFSLSGASLRNILLGGFLGMIPRTVLAVWTSLQVRNIKILLENPNESTTNQILLIGLFVVSVVGLYAVLQKVILKKK